MQYVIVVMNRGECLSKAETYVEDTVGGVARTLAAWCGDAWNEPSIRHVVDKLLPGDRADLSDDDTEIAVFVPV